MAKWKPGKNGVYLKNGHLYRDRSKTTAIDPGEDYLYGEGKDVGDTYTTWKHGNGFVKPDLGKLSGPAIPYQAVKKEIKGKTRHWTEDLGKYTPPKRDTHFTYRVRRGDTLSEIAQRYGMDWRDLWWYNMHTRNQHARNVLRRRGPDLIYKNSAFYIPTGDARAAAIRRRLLR